jgi:hypothetical protein
MKRKEFFVIMNKSLILFIIIIKLSRNYEIKNSDENLNLNIFNYISFNNCSFFNQSNCNFCGPGKIFNLSNLFNINFCYIC